MMKAMVVRGVNRVHLLLDDQIEAPPEKHVIIIMADRWKHAARKIL